jgi:hypothetical protein
MTLEQIYEIAKPRPPFWVNIWVFFFLLINRKEGKRLIKELIEKVDELTKKTEALTAKAEQSLKQSTEVLEKLGGVG